MGKVTRPLWLEAISERKQKVEAQQNEAQRWERVAQQHLREVVEACTFFGFYVEAIDDLTIGIVPEHLANEFVNVDVSSIRIIKPNPYESRGYLDDKEHALQVTYAPSIVNMVEKERGPFDDPPRDDEEVKLVPEPPEVITLFVKDHNGYVRTKKETIEYVLHRIIARLIDLKHPELRLAKES
jgi:hypothetical protein